jgi:hypothetical protein
MAGFKTHVTFSSLLGVGYAGVGLVHFHMPPDTAILGGALCGFSGMLPDIDSDYGVPLRETMAFTAAVLPMLLLHRFHSLGLKPDEMALLGIGVYLFVRFGLTNMIRKYTVHRGMFHSIPAGLTFAGVAFLVVGDSIDLDVRYFKAGGVLAGFMSHLILDEIYSVEWKGGAWRLKKSSGTALKLWGKDPWANFSTYGKLILVGGAILGEPSVMQQVQSRNPELANRYEQLQDRYRGWSDGFAAKLRAKLPEAESEIGSQRAWNPFASQQSPQPGPAQSILPSAPNNAAPPPQNANPFGQPPSQFPVQPGGNGFDTAQRPQWPGQQ